MNRADPRTTNGVVYPPTYIKIRHFQKNFWNIQQDYSRSKYFQGFLSYLIKSTTHGGSNDQTQTEEGFEAGKSGGDVIREFFGDNGETSRKKGRISHRLDDPNHERKDYEGIMTVHLVQ